jgi:hypothetical protein
MKVEPDETSPKDFIKFQLIFYNLPKDYLQQRFIHRSHFFFASTDSKIFNLKNENSYVCQ